MFAFHINISEHFGHAAWFLQRIILSFQRTPSDMPFLRLQQPSTSIFECQVFHFNGKLQVLICAQNTQLWASSWKMLFVPLCRELLSSNQIPSFTQFDYINLIFAWLSLHFVWTISPVLFQCFGIHLNGG